MTRDELIVALLQTGLGTDNVFTEGCCGGCYVSADAVSVDTAGQIVIQEMA